MGGIFLVIVIVDDPGVDLEPSDVGGMVSLELDAFAK